MYAVPNLSFQVSTRSRPKAADQSPDLLPLLDLFQHAAARRRLKQKTRKASFTQWFQHAAARRRLRSIATIPGAAFMFQHAAARRRLT